MLILGIARAESPPIESPPFAHLISKLTQGGLIIYWRHTRTDHAYPDKRPFIPDNCHSQRNLDTQGVMQAVHIGNRLSALRIPVTEIISSPYCRCTDTAEYAFGKTPKVHSSLAYSLGEPRIIRQQHKAYLLQQLQTSPNNGGNRVIISHTANLQEAVSIWPQQEGDMVIFEPTTPPRYVGYISIDDWNQIQ